MNTYFMADPHIEHEGVLQMCNRPFLSIEEHNEAILEGINHKVGVDDRLFILGDAFWHSEESWFKKIRCKNVHLIVGNHDRAKAAKLFKTVNDTLLLKLSGERVFLSHYAQAYWPASHNGSFHLYGHTHFQREATLEALFPGRRAMDVGVDAYFQRFGVYAPFSWAYIYDTLRHRRGHDDVQFYLNFQEEARRNPRWTREQMLTKMQVYREAYGG